MTIQVIITLTILLVATLLFVSNKVRVDLIALFVLCALVLSGVVSPSEALSGFSNPAVITVWAVFILSAGLAKTGIALVIGQQVLRISGKGEARLIFVIMLLAAGLSAFMNNIGVAALLLPVVMDIARRTKIPPSRLLMPLAFGCLLGGTNTLIGTPPNILASGALRDYGFDPFALFDFTPTGFFITLGGIAFMMIVGRRLLGMRTISTDIIAPSYAGLEQVFDISGVLSVIKLPSDTMLAGKTLLESRLGAMLGVSVIGIIRNKKTKFAPSADEVLFPGDRLLVIGRLDRLKELKKGEYLFVEGDEISIEQIISESVQLAEILITNQSSLVNKTIREINFRNRYRLIVLAIWRDEHSIRTGIDNIPLRKSDILLVQGRSEDIEKMQEEPGFDLLEYKSDRDYQLQDRLVIVRIPQESFLVNKSLKDSRLSEAFGLSVLGMGRNDQIELMPFAETILKSNDILIVKGRIEHLASLGALRDLDIDFHEDLDLSVLDAPGSGVIEAVLSPFSKIAGKTLQQLHFRDKYGLNVLAIWRGGRAFRTHLQDMQIQLGDALLLFGKRDNLRMLSSDEDFIVLTQDIQEEPRYKKGPLAALILVAVLTPVVMGIIPISIAAVIGATFMVASGCLDMDEAYRAIDWRSVFLIAGMIPLGIAMESSGATSAIADFVVSGAGEFGPMAILISLFLLTSVTSQVMPNAIVTVLMSPIAINAAREMSVSPYSLVMTVAIAASASFLSPVGHPANVLVMGPGGYRFIDFIKVGLPLTVVIFFITILVLPLIWPL